MLSAAVQWQVTFLYSLVTGHKVHRVRSLVGLALTQAADLQDGQKSEAQRLLADAEALMAEIGSGDYTARQAKKAADAANEAEAGLATRGLKLRCDVNGCVIVPINAQQYTPGLTGSLISSDNILFCCDNVHAIHLTANAILRVNNQVCCPIAPKLRFWCQILCRSLNALH